MPIILIIDNHATRPDDELLFMSRTIDVGASGGSMSIDGSGPDVDAPISGTCHA
jgi:hypothetical protein